MELPTSKNGNSHLMVCIDMFSKWPEAFPLTSKSSEELTLIFH